MLQSIQQTSKHPTLTSDRYAFVPTTAVIDVLKQNGWEIRQAVEVRARGERRGYQKHMIQFRNALNSVPLAESTTPEIVLVNSHQGSSSFQLMLGMFRGFCSNGMIFGSATETYRVKHVGYTDEKVAQALAGVLKDTPKMAEAIDRFRTINLDREQQRAYAQAAIELRFDGEKFAVEPDRVLATRRIEDNRNDLWTTFNRVQENIIKGGVRARTTDGRRTTARAIGSIDENVRLNRALWTLTEKMAELAAR